MLEIEIKSEHLLVGIKGNIDKYLNVGTPNPFHFIEPQPMNIFERTETLNPGLKLPQHALWGCCESLERFLTSEIPNPNPTDPGIAHPLGTLQIVGEFLDH